MRLRVTPGATPVRGSANCHRLPFFCLRLVKESGMRIGRVAGETSVFPPRPPRDAARGMYPTCGTLVPRARRGLETTSGWSSRLPRGRRRGAPLTGAGPRRRRCADRRSHSLVRQTPPFDRAVSASRRTTETGGLSRKVARTETKGATRGAVRSPTSDQTRLPAELKHISKRRKRN